MLTPKCEELERAVGGRNWLDMMIVYFDEYAYEQREFTRRLNGLIGEMNDACVDRMTFVQELRSVVGESVPAKTAVFLEQMINKEGSRECQLADLVNEGREEPQFIYYCERSKLDDIRLARQINALCDTLTTVIDGIWPFITELEMSLMRNIDDQMYLKKGPGCGRDPSNCNLLHELLLLCRIGGKRCSTNLCSKWPTQVDKYIRELRAFDISDEVIDSIEILKRVQVNDMEKASRLLLMAREIQTKVFKKNTFIARIRD
nr:hypothetical protein [Tanacetum cinerariifolium]